MYKNITRKLKLDWTVDPKTGTDLSREGMALSASIRGALHSQQGDGE